MKIKKLIIFILLTASASFCCEGQAAEDCKRAVPCPVKTDSVVESILKKLNKKTANLNTYQAKIRLMHTQPLFETVTVRKGDLYYIKDANNAKLRINFETLKQDDSKEQKHCEDFILDGVWLGRIDYQNKTISFDQLAPETAPVEPFEMVSRYFPILGFSGTEDLKKQFGIEYIKPAKEADDWPIQLRLMPKADSRYKDSYTQIDFWIADKIDLPTKIIAQSNETDIFEISFSDIKINKKLKLNIFKVEKPQDFSENRTFLQQK